MNVVHLKQFLRPHECLEMIDWATALEFNSAPVRTLQGLAHMPNIRNNDKIQEWNLDRAHTLETRAIRQGVHTENEHWNPMLRVYRYSPGQVFKTHRDGQERFDHLVSFKTILIYLNTTDGGETVLMPNGKGDPDTYQIVSPQQGDLLMFDHRIWHEARPVHSGYKFVLRSDLMRSGE